MNTLSLFNPSFASDVFDAFDRGISVTSPTVTTSPRVDVRETKTAYVLEMDLPGFSENDVEIHLKDRVLSVASLKEAKKEEKEKDEVQYLIKERRAICFTRRFSLPDDIDPDNVAAAFKNGVLSVTISRKPESQPRQIKIQAD